MPLAKLPRYPAVEAFLRGPRSSFVYTGLNDFNHATDFARKDLRASCQDGYSAIAEAGVRGGAAYCLITKTRDAFQQSVILWKNEQGEMPRLQTRIRNLQTGTAQETRRNPIEVVVLSPDSSPHHDKKQKVETTVYRSDNSRLVA